MRFTLNDQTLDTRKLAYTLNVLETGGTVTMCSHANGWTTSITLRRERADCWYATVSRYHERDGRRAPLHILQAGSLLLLLADITKSGYSLVL